MLPIQVRQGQQPYGDDDDGSAADGGRDDVPVRYGESLDERERPGRLTNNGRFSYTYNTAGLLRMTRAQGVTATQVYTYNGDGLLMARNTSKYVWDQAADLPQMLSDGRVLYIPGVGQWDGKDWTYELPDGLDSMRQLADAQGYLVQRYEYGPFGEALASEGKRANSLRYTGERFK